MKKIKYEIISEHEYSLEVKLQKCNHIVRIGKEDIEKGAFICNVCSNLNNDEYMYTQGKGVQHKSTMIRQCKICKTKDVMDRLIPIPQPIKNGAFNFWFFHESCIGECEHTVESVKSILEDKTIKNKTSILLKGNIAKQAIQTENDTGDSVNGVGMKMKIINRTAYDIVSLKGLCGVYSIYNWKNNRRYIGSTRHLGRRLKQHVEMLELNVHHSYKLQSDFNKRKHGEFEFEVLETLDADCSVEMLTLTEQKYMDLVNSAGFGYNVNPIAKRRS